MMKKLLRMLTTPDEYDGITWLDVICACVISSSMFIGLAFAIRFFC